jgi:carbamoylphosphate synthase small subunit
LQGRNGRVSSACKLKFGHRGGNHPVRELETGRVHITAQNHGFAVDADTLKGGLELSQHAELRKFWRRRFMCPSAMISTR